MLVKGAPGNMSRIQKVINTKVGLGSKYVTIQCVLGQAKGTFVAYS